MKKILAFVVVASAFVGWSMSPDFKPGYDVKPSSIVPDWFGAESGKWTMDYESALDNASTEGKCTLLLFSGMWWCPHCQALESKVLLSDTFRRYVEANGYYLTVLDFPYRNGGSNWCWLWDSFYRSEIAYGALSDEDATRELIGRYRFQDQMSKHTTHQTATNYVVTVLDGCTNLVPYAEMPVSEYDRVGYPTIIVIDPFGNDIGRFNFSYREFKDRPDSEAIDYVIDSIERIRTESRPVLFGNPGEGVFSGTRAVKYFGWLTDAASGSVVGSLTVKTGRRSRKGKSKISATLEVGGRKKVVSSTVTVSDGSVLLSKGTAAVALSLDDNSMRGEAVVDGVSYSLTGGVDDDCGFSGTWPVALLPVRPVSPFAMGYGALTVKVSSKGNVKISGTLGDGTSIRLNCRAIVGESGMAAVPIVDQPYGRGKGGIGAVLWFKDGLLVNATEILDWSCNKSKKAFSTGWTPKFSAQPGFGQLVDGSEMEIMSFPQQIKGEEVFVSPECDFIHVKTVKRWLGQGDSKAVLTYDPRTGFVKGTVSVSVLSRTGRAKSKKLSVRAVLLDGTAYGTVMIPNECTCPVKICDCSGCEE